MSLNWPDALGDWVARSCKEQGLEVRVTDKTVLKRVAALVRQSGSGGIACHPSRNGAEGSAAAMARCRAQKGAADGSGSPTK